MSAVDPSPMVPSLREESASEEIRIVDTGLVYRNPKPYLETIYAMHPSLSVVSDQELICSFDVGNAPESLDYHTVMARSLDQGKTWTLEDRLMEPDFMVPSTHSIRTACLRDGRVLGVGALYHRPDKNEGIFSRVNLGAVPMDLFIVSSDDAGRTWSSPRLIQSPLQSPGWEVSHCPLELKDGRLGIPLGTWRGWDGKLPCGQQTIIIFSEDGGETWPDCGRVFDGRESGFIHWEQCLIERENELLAVAWEYDPEKQENRASIFATSTGLPSQFGAPLPTGFQAETCEIVSLGESRILAVYRGADKPGLWAVLADVKEGQWANEFAAPIWQGPLSRMDGKTNHADELANLKFGSPSMKVLPGGDVLVVFWCHEDGITQIRWIRLGIS